MQQPTNDGWQTLVDWPVNARVALAVLASLECAAEESPAHLIDMATALSAAIAHHEQWHITSIELLASYIMALRSKEGVPAVADLIPTSLEGN